MENKTCSKPPISHDLPIVFPRFFNLGIDGDISMEFPREFPTPIWEKLRNVIYYKPLICSAINLHIDFTQNQKKTLISPKTSICFHVFGGFVPVAGRFQPGFGATSPGRERRNARCSSCR